MNQDHIRRMVKQRQKAAAKAAASHKKQCKRFSMRQAVATAKIRQQHIDRENTTKDLLIAGITKTIDQVRTIGSVIIKLEKPEDYMEWADECRNIIAKLRENDDHRIRWNESWHEDEQLTIAIVH